MSSNTRIRGQPGVWFTAGREGMGQEGGKEEKKRKREIVEETRRDRRGGTGRRKSRGGGEREKRIHTVRFLSLLTPPVLQ